MLLSFDITCDWVTVLAIACVGLRVYEWDVGRGWDVVIRSDSTRIEGYGEACYVNNEVSRMGI